MDNLNKEKVEGEDKDKVRLSVDCESENKKTALILGIQF